MIQIFALTLPIYLIIATGYVAVKTGYVSADDVRALGRIAMRICMPVTIFVNISRTPLSESFRWDFLGGYLIGSLVVFASGLLVAQYVLRQPRGMPVLMGLGMSTSNSAFMGVPIAAMVIGDVALQAFTMVLLVENMVMMPLAMLIADRTGGRGLWAVLIRPMLTNPLLIAVVAGGAVATMGLAPPAPVAQTLNMLAVIAAPVALLAVGGTVAALSFAPVRMPIALVVFGKLILHPLAVLGILSLTGTVPGPLLLSGVIIAAVPMMSIYGLFGQRWGHEALAATALILATVVSFGTVSALLWLIFPGPL